MHPSVAMILACVRMAAHPDMAVLVTGDYLTRLRSGRPSDTAMLDDGYLLCGTPDDTSTALDDGGEREPMTCRLCASVRRAILGLLRSHG